ncbi:hypothetical protein LTR65_003637 [Meristemomyces frigidus]
MGKLYTDVVINCLTCLDDDNADCGDCNDYEDANGVFMGVKYIEKVLLKLNEILV